MKAYALASIALLSLSAQALSIVNKHQIIDPPRNVAYLQGNAGPVLPPPPLGIVTPNGPVGTETDKPTEPPFPGQASFLDSDDYDPASPQAEAFLQQVDAVYEAETGESAYPTGKTVDNGNIDPRVRIAEGTSLEGLVQLTAGCVRQSCAVWAHVNKATQTIRIYVNGSPIALPNSRTASGAPGHGTPNFDKHPDGRIYTKYSSKKFPGGNWNGLGNMPYAVFISGGFALHGTPSIGSLGRPASHGCVRLHPATGKLFNSLVRQYGVSNTWITVN